MSRLVKLALAVAAAGSLVFAQDGSMEGMDDASILNEFKETDADSDGFITVEEIKKQASMEEPDDTPSDAELQDIMTHFDSDKDGKISFEEFKTNLHTDEPPMDDFDESHLDAAEDAAPADTP